MRSFAVEGVDVPVLVSRVDGSFFACSGICPHEDVELGDGTLEPERLTVICHAHGYCFDLKTGHCTPDDRLVLPRFRTEVVGDELWIELFAAP